MFLGTYDIDEYVNIPAVTHRFSSGAAYAPTAITYSIYEEGNAVGLDENVDMTPASPFDTITGFYYARRQLTAAAGFERNKTYVVLLKATVDSVSALEVHQFQVRYIQSGDSFARIGAPAGASVSADVAAVKAVLPTALVSGRIDASVGAMASGVVTAAAVATGAIDADALATDAVNEIVDQVWDEVRSGHTTVGTFGDVSTAADVASAVLSAAATTPIDANVQEINDVTVVGNGSTTPWGP